MKAFGVTALAVLVMSGAALSSAPARAADLDYSYGGYQYDPLPEPPPYEQSGAYYDRPGPDYAGGCVPPRVIQDRLYRNGWYDVQEVNQRPGRVVLLARQDDGLLYRLSIDRCSGMVVNAHLVEDAYPGGPYPDEVAVVPPPGPDPYWNGPAAPPPYGPDYY